MVARLVLTGFLVCSMARINLAAGSTLLPAIQAQGSDIKIAVPAGDVIFDLQDSVCTASQVCGHAARIETLQGLVATQSIALSTLQTLVATQSTAIAEQSTRITQLETARLTRAARTDAEFARMIAHDLSLCDAACLAGVCANYSDSSGHGVRCVCNPGWSGAYCDVPDQAPTQAPTPRPPSMAPSVAPTAPCSATFGNRTWLPEIMGIPTVNHRPRYFVRVVTIASNELHKDPGANSNKISDADINAMRAAGTGIMYFRCGNAYAWVDDEGTDFAGYTGSGARAMTRCATYAWGPYRTGPNTGSDLRGIDCQLADTGGHDIIYAHRAQDGLGGCINRYGHGSTGALYVECPPNCSDPERSRYAGLYCP